MKSSPRWLAKRTPLPSGVQSRTVSSAEWIVRRLTAPPAVGITIDVHVSLAVGGKRDRAAVRGEPRVDVAGRVDGQPLDVLAVLVGGPDVAEIGEGDLAGVIIGVTHQLRLARRRQSPGRRAAGPGRAKMGLIMDVVPKWMFEARIHRVGRAVVMELGDQRLADPRITATTEQSAS